MKPLGNEKGFQRTLIHYAQSRGWIVAHFRPATVRDGRTVTPVAADGAGFLDLTMVRRNRLLFVECKGPHIRKLRPAQQMWFDALRTVAADSHGTIGVYVWNPSDWVFIEEALK